MPGNDKFISRLGRFFKRGGPATMMEIQAAEAAASSVYDHSATAVMEATAPSDQQPTSDDDYDRVFGFTEEMLEEDGDTNGGDDAHYSDAQLSDARYSEDEFIGEIATPAERIASRLHAVLTPTRRLPDPVKVVVTPGEGGAYDVCEGEAAPQATAGIDAYVSMFANDDAPRAADELADAVRDHRQNRRGARANRPLVSRELPVDPVAHAGTGPAAPVEPRGLMLRPWRRQSEALTQMQKGFNTLTELMGSIRQNLETQNRRQDELISHLSTLPKVLDMIPEASRMQTEAFKVIQSQLGLQADHQNKLGDILDRMTAAGQVQTSSIESLSERVESLKEHDEAIAFNLNAVGSAMAGVSKNTQSSAEVLEHMKETLGSRDHALIQIIDRQGTRVSMMMTVAVGLSLVSVATMAVVGVIMLVHMH